MISILILLSVLNLFAQTTLDDLKWYLNPNGQNIEIGLDDLHDETVIASPSLSWGRESLSEIKLLKKVTVAVVDGGIDFAHPELIPYLDFQNEECFLGNIIPDMKEDRDGNDYKGDCLGWNFVDDNNKPDDLDGHGTHVSGLIAEVIKTLPDKFIKILPLKVFAPGEGQRNVKVSTPLPTRLVKAIDYAIKRGVDVVNFSAGWPRSFMTYELENKLLEAMRKGIIVVAAAGNSTQRATIFPCQVDGVICVGALRGNGELAPFSNWGTQVDILAPGEKILSTIPMSLAPLHISRRGYDYKNGTSQAVPFVAGAVAVLKSAYPSESVDLLKTRLFFGATPLKDQKGSLFGMFNLSRALNSAPSNAIIPNLKDIRTVTVDSELMGSFKLKLKNLSHHKVQANFHLDCGSLIELTRDSNKVSSLAPSIEEAFNFYFRLPELIPEIKCSLKLGLRDYKLSLKVLKDLGTPATSIRVDQDNLYVINTRQGTKSRFLTIPTLNGDTAEGFYQVQMNSKTIIFHLARKIGDLPIEKGCELLRIWQLDLALKHQKNFLVESHCKSFLSYTFFDNELNPLWSPIRYRPSLTLVNYDKFELIRNQQGPPSLRFLNVGLPTPNNDPWGDEIVSKRRHLYELRPVWGDDHFSFVPHLLENEQNWVKSLGLRFKPNFKVYHLVKDKLLIGFDQKYAWVDIATQKATLAKIGNWLLDGSQSQKIFGEDSVILQSFLTPYEYRGALPDSHIELRYIQRSRTDPLIDIIGTKRTTNGYESILRSFQHIIWVEYDLNGQMISENIMPLERFDFLSAQDLIATVINVKTPEHSFLFVDGTKINTNYVDIVKNKTKTSYEVPSNCSTQLPIILDGQLVLPVFCGLTKSEFEMKFFKI
jgi:hypothetical protein